MIYNSLKKRQSTLDITDPKPDVFYAQYSMRIGSSKYWH